LRQEELERLREQEGKIESLFAKQSFLESGFADAIDDIHEIEEVLVQTRRMLDVTQEEL